MPESRDTDSTARRAAGGGAAGRSELGKKIARRGVSKAPRLDPCSVYVRYRTRIPYRERFGIRIVPRCREPPTGHRTAATQRGTRNGRDGGERVRYHG